MIVMFQVMHLAYEFGPFRLDPAARHLFRDGEPVGLTPKAFDVLVALVEAGGEVVERERLMDRVWPATAVVDANLTQTVSVLRRVLGDTATEHSYIATVPGRGYQFTAPVEAAVPAPVAGRFQPAPPPGEKTWDAARRPSVPGWRSRLTPSRLLLALPALVALLTALAVVADRAHREPEAGERTVQSLAVLPLTVLTPESLEPAFGVGLSDAITNRLSNQGSLAVRSTQAVLPYARAGSDPLEVARELGVDLVLTGTARQSGGEVRVSVQLVDVEREHPLWAATFDQPTESLFAIEDQIAERVSWDFALDLVGTAEGAHGRLATESGEAYRQFLLGRASFLERWREGSERAIRHFERALEHDPEYAAALAHLAMTRALMASNGNCWAPSRRVMNRALVEARRAIELDPEIPEGYVALGAVLMNERYDWSGADEAFRQAVELDPASSRSRYLLAMALALRGEDERAWAEARRLERARAGLPPALDADGRFSYGLLAVFLGHYEEGRRALAGISATEPHRGGARMYLAISLEALGRSEQALTELEAATLHYRSSHQAAATLAHYLGRSDDPGQRARGREILEGLEEQPETAPASLLSLAIAHAGAGSKEAAIRYLWQAHEAREVLPIVVQRDPRLDPLRGEPEFERLLEAMNLGQAPEA